MATKAGEEIQISSPNGSLWRGNRFRRQRVHYVDELIFPRPKTKIWRGNEHFLAKRLPFGDEI